MRKPTNHIASVLLPVLILLPLFCILAVQAWQVYLKNGAEERLEKGSVETMVIKTNQIHWEKKGKEISINGKMFDVKSFHINGNNITVTGMYDEKETAINKLLSQQFDNNNLLIQLLALAQFIFLISAIFFLLKFFKLLIPYFYFPPARYRSIGIEIQTPPPRYHFHLRFIFF